ncbi:MAG: hypothetical protein GEU91_18575 [Rhizobiales bacterium]|nr:hypothetical protein [Hyphomicrobiales bacterium]
MTMPSIESATIAEAPARKHRWEGHRWIHGHDSPDGCSRTERTCVLCTMVKITVHPPQGLPWREWRTFDGKVWHGTATPPCLDRVAG